MRKVVVVYFIGMILLCLLGNLLVRYDRVMRILIPDYHTGRSDTNDYSFKIDPKNNYDFEDYRKSQIAFSSFDLFAGLSKNEIETVRSQATFFFACLVACLMVLHVLREP